MDPKDETRAKYDRIARAYSARYADADAIAQRQRDLIMRWGTTIGPGATVLEVGCGDGFSTVGLARAGLDVTALDISEEMVSITSQRLRAAGLHGRAIVADIETFPTDDTFDAVALFMGAFFSYVADAGATLDRLARMTRVKLLVDLNPRETDVDTATALLRTAGFSDVKQRAFLVPQRFRVPRLMRPVARALETAPLVASLALQRKFHAVLKGERV